MTMTRDEPRSARAEELRVQTMRDVHKEAQTNPKTLAGCSLCRLAPGQLGPDEPTFSQIGNINNFGPLFKLEFLVKSIISQAANLTHVLKSACLVPHIPQAFLTAHRNTGIIRDLDFSSANFPVSDYFLPQIRYNFKINF